MTSSVRRWVTKACSPCLIFNIGKHWLQVYEVAIIRKVILGTVLDIAAKSL